MSFRQALLRVLLWSLGIAAVCGALATLIGSLGTVSRVMGTAMLTAGASLLLLGAAYLVDRPLTRAAGLLGMTAVVVEYLLLLALMWLGGGDQLAITAGLLSLPVVPAMLCLTMAGAPHTRVAGRVGVAGCLAVSALLLGGTWLHRFPWHEDYWYGLAGAIAVFLPVVVACLVGAGADRRHWRWVGVAAAVVATAATFYVMVNNPRGGEGVFAALVSVALVVAHANLMMLLPLKPAQHWVRRGTILATFATAAFIDLNIVTSGRNTGNWSPMSFVYERLAGASAVVAGCGTMALLVLGRMNRRVVATTVTLESIREVTLVCPACRKKQTLPVGDSRCASCRVLIHTRFEEPRCAACGYSLFMLASDRCPECGTEVRDTPAADAPARDTPIPVDSGLSDAAQFQEST